MLRGARVTKEAYPVGAVVLLRDRDMQDAWCFATSRTDLSARQIAKLYGKRFTTEETFRDQKDLRFGMGLNQTHISDPKRRCIAPAQSRQALCRDNNAAWSLR